MRFILYNIKEYKEGGISVKHKLLSTIGLLCCTALALVTCHWIYARNTTPSIPTANLVDGETKTAATSGTTVSTTTTAATTVTTTTSPTQNVTHATALPSDNPHARTTFSFTAQQKQQLDDMLAGFGGNVAVWYEDLESSYTYQYNAQHTFFAASIIKAPYCMYILQRAAQGTCDLNQKIAYTEGIKSDGTGIVKKSPYGTEFTVQQLVENAICHSDNAALRMLRSVYAAEGFRDFSKSIGIKKVAAISNITGANINAADAATYMRAIYNFIQTDKEHGALLKKYMTSTINPMFASSYTLMRKYGWATDAFHDTAIVDAPHPYILVFLTDHAEGTAEDFAMFRTLSKTIEQFSAQPTE